MAKQTWKPGNMVYPLPAVMVSAGNKEGKTNIITIAWVGTICTNPAMLYISVRPERYSYDMIRESGEFVVNLTTEDLVKETDYCGVKSGRDCDKFKEDISKCDIIDIANEEMKKIDSTEIDNICEEVIGKTYTNDILESIAN